MSDHMPFDILWHFLDFIAELLHFIFAEIPDIFIINFLKHLKMCIRDRCKKEIPVVEQGIFGADMKISLLNDGPFTIILDSAEIC